MECWPSSNIGMKIKSKILLNENQLFTLEHFDNRPADSYSQYLHFELDDCNIVIDVRSSYCCLLS